MFKLFTLEGAHRLLPDVDARLHTLKDAIDDLETTQRRLQGVRGSTVEALAARHELAFLVSAVHDAKQQLSALGVMVPDAELDVVELPARIGGEVVHLVWEPGQATITHYHRLTGDNQRRPLPTRRDPISDGGPTPTS